MECRSGKDCPALGVDSSPHSSGPSLHHRVQALPYPDPPLNLPLYSIWEHITEASVRQGILEEGAGGRHE